MSPVDAMTGVTLTDEQLERRQHMTDLEMEIDAKIQALFPRRGVRMQHHHVDGYSVGNINTTEGVWRITLYHYVTDGQNSIGMTFLGKDNDS